VLKVIELEDLRSDYVCEFNSADIQQNYLDKAG
jgi:hypothetical protein